MAVIIGAAFTTIVGSLTKGITNPILAAIIGKTNVSAPVLDVLGAKIAHGNFSTP